MALHSQTSAGLASGCQASQFSVLVLGPGDPVDPGVVPDGVVGRVDQDDLVVLVDTVLGNPVRVEDSQTTKGGSDSLLGLGSKVSGGLQLVDTD